jgi:hypothetical protein
MKKLKTIMKKARKELIGCRSIMLCYDDGYDKGRAEALAEVEKILDKWYMRLWRMSKNPSANYFDDLKFEIESLVESKEVSK